MSEQPKLSPVDQFKLESDYLRGTIAEELASDEDHFGKSSVQLLKHYGTYQQDDRDARSRMREEGKKGKAFMFMVRSKIPGGRLTSEQLLAELDLCDELGNGTLRVTSRQGLQLHGIVKDDLAASIKRIHDIDLSTLGACGDVNRNVMCCPAPYRHDPVHKQMQALADDLAAHFAPRTCAYHEIFLQDPETGEKEMIASTKNGEVEPIYGKQYLPRKFKMSVGLPGDNCIDMYTHDLSFMAVCRDYEIVGYNVLVGGGQGRTPSAEKTFPALAHKMCSIPPDAAVKVAEAVVKVQRDFGNRSDRKVARMKYLIHDWGLEKFKAKVEEYYGQPLNEPWEDDVHGHDDHMGWSEQGDGAWFYGLNIENGRIQDCDEFKLKTALREICRNYQPGIHLTAHQGMIFTDVKPEDREGLIDTLRRYNVQPSEGYSEARRWSMACVAWPTCGLSITESERALPGIMDQLEAELTKLDLMDEQFTVRMTGCPNGCARPYNCDIGLVGRSKEKYTLFLGGHLLGDRLNWEYKDQVPADEVVSELVPVFQYFKQDREPGETFGDFCDRKGVDDLLAWTTQFQAQLAG